MTSIWMQVRCQLRLVSSLVMRGVLIASLGDCAFAQIAPDTTLGSENSSVMPMTPTVDQINGGATRGTNLFHSFQEFNVGEGRSAYFTNPAGIENILTRVTGTNPSNILGTLGVSGGNANLFLINPNGIIFGQNARLDVGGSFVASTASSLNFADGTQFSATAPQTTPLLTVSVPIGLQFGTTAGSIRNESQATNSSEEIVGLQVQPGKTLALVGGDVSLDGGKLHTPGSRVELGGVAGSGTVRLNVDGNNLGLSFADGVALSDVSLTNGAEVNVRAGGGGSIAINARSLNISGDRTRVRAGIDSGLGSVDSMAGDIEINATEAINIDASVISNVVLSVIEVDGVLEEGVGNGGNINITTGSLRVSNGAQLVASTFGQGNAGSVNINARDTVSFDGGYAVSVVGQTGVGDGGNINITAGSLSITNGAQLVASTFGQGNAGSVNINARDTVSFDGGYAVSVVGQTGVGDGGNINITARSLSITNGAQLVASTFGLGNSGSVFLQVDDSVSLAGRNSAIFSKVEAGGVGNGGNINITAGSLSLTDGAQLQTFVANWRTRDPIVPVGGYGNAGDVNINVRDTITLVGKGKDSGASLTAIMTGVGYRAVGNGGNINIRARELSLTNAQLGSDTRGQGHAGNVFIRVVDSIYLTTTDNVLEGIRRSRIGSAVAPDAEGNAGNIDIQARSLFLNNGAVLDATTQGNGNAGDIRVSANTLTATNGGQILTTSRSSFRAGTIRLDITDSVTLSGSDPNFAQRRARSEPGTVIILDSPASGVFADTRGGGGNINLYTGDLILRRGSSINTNATGSNIPGGNITIDTDNLVAIPKENSDISANATESFGGRVIINAKGIFGTQFRPQDTPLSDITASSELGPQFNGVVQLNTPGIDPSRGLTNLPTEVVDASNQIDQTCGAGRGEARKNKFIITGHRGMPSNPYEMLSNDEALADIHPPPGFSSSRNSLPDAAKTVTSQSATSNPKPPIVEAQGWVINDKGQVALTATAPTVTPHNSLPASATCPSS